jgi:flagellar biosynthesis chaperone FliJ
MEEQLEQLKKDRENVEQNLEKTTNSNLLKSDWCNRCINTVVE